MLVDVFGQHDSKHLLKVCQSIKSQDVWISSIEIFAEPGPLLEPGLPSFSRKVLHCDAGSLSLLIKWEPQWILYRGQRGLAVGYYMSDCLYGFLLPSGSLCWGRR